jgi:3-oxoacyl-[acyl-carrier protein] reductase
VTIADRLRFDGRVAVVTGAARGIGLGCARALAELGADLALCDRDGPELRDAAAELASIGRRVEARTLDVRDEDATAAFVAEAAATLGRIDVVVNNAGGMFFAPFAAVTPKGERTLVDENFRTVTNVVRPALAHLTRPGGAIVNITSIEAHRAAPGMAVYGAMKAAVEALSKTLALELASEGIRVNCVAPDSIVTGGAEAVAASNPTPFTLGGLGPGQWTPLSPSGEVGYPEDVAAAVAYLASDLARFVTGTVVHVDGGNNAAGGWHRRDHQLAATEVDA